MQFPCHKHFFNISQSFSERTIIIQNDLAMVNWPIESNAIMSWKYKEESYEH